MDAPPIPNPKRQRRQYDDSETRKWEIYEEFVTVAAKGDLETVQQMLEVDMIVPVDCLDGFNDQTALYAASTRGHVLVVQYLIQAGANVNWAFHDHCPKDGTNPPSCIQINCSLLSNIMEAVRENG